MIQAGEGNRQKICRVCSDKAMGFNFNAITCESCKAFFRRNAFKNEKLRCPFNDDCIIDKSTRRFCQKCRLEKCLQVGMKKEWILSEEQKKMKRAKVAENRLKRKPDDSEGQRSDDLVEPLDKMKRHSSRVADTPVTSSTLSISCSSSSSSRFEDDVGTQYVYNFSDNPLSQFHDINSQPINQGEYLTNVSTLNEDNLLNSTSNGNSMTSTSQHVIPVAKVYDLEPSSLSSERYSNLKAFATLTSHLLDRDSFDTDWSSLLHDPSNSQCVFSRKSMSNDHISSDDRITDYLHNNGKNLSESMESQNQSSNASIDKATPAYTLRSQLLINEKNNSDYDRREASWRLAVNHRLLEADFTPNYLRTDPDGFINILTDLEQAKISELLKAFSIIDEPILDNTCAKDSNISDVIRFSDLAIRRLIRWCKNIQSFSSLCLDDQMALLKSGCLEMLSMKASFNFNLDDESWQDGYTKNGLKLNIFRKASEKLYQAHQQFIKTFDQRWRTDHRVNLLLVSIVLFNPDRPNLRHPVTVRLEHYTYIYLLRRYLETKSDSLCQARSDHYHLMMKIEDLRELHEKTLRLYTDAGPEVVGPLLIEMLDLK